MEEFTNLGYATVPSGLEPAAISRIGESLFSAYERQQAEMAADGVDLENTRDADVVRCALAYHDDFVELATNVTLVAIARRVFGESFVLLQQNGLINRP